MSESIAAGVAVSRCSARVRPVTQDSPLSLAKTRIFPAEQSEYVNAGDGI